MSTTKRAIRCQDLSTAEIARFWSRVRNRRWVGCKVRGYGQIKVNGHYVLAHIVAYALHFGEVPTGSLVRHKCDNLHSTERHGTPTSYRNCVDWRHLQLGDDSSNYWDAVTRRRVPRVKLSWDKVKLIRALRKEDPIRYKLRVLGKMFGVTLYDIHNVCAGKSWKLLKISKRVNTHA